MQFINVLQVLHSDMYLARADALLWSRNVSAAREMLPLLSSKVQSLVGARINIQSGSEVDIDDLAGDAPSPAWAASLYFDQAVRLRKAALAAQQRHKLRRKGG